MSEERREKTIEELKAEITYLKGKYAEYFMRAHEAEYKLNMSVCCIKGGGSSALRQELGWANIRIRKLEEKLRNLKGEYSETEVYWLEAVQIALKQEREKNRALEIENELLRRKAQLDLPADECPQKVQIDKEERFLRRKCAELAHENEALRSFQGTKVTELRRQRKEVEKNVEYWKRQSSASKARVADLESKVNEQRKIQGVAYKSDVTREKIKELQSAGMSNTQIAEELGVSRQTVYNRLKEE